ncbi:MAG: deoxyribodipyrimidine photolyase [Thermoguttaceae bacterium]|nr:deoxyribodipyrimidine photolyase [Thermoguttaceae bacterium]
MPACRIRPVNAASPQASGEFVLYWMNAFRRAGWNFSLDRAVAWSVELNRPLVVFETLPCGRRWDSVRHHRFVLDGMAENARRFDRPGVLYHPYVEATPGAAREAALALGRHACVVVTDDFPLREHVSQIDAVARRLGTLIEAVDSNGLLPLRAADRVFPTAHSFRRFLQRTLPEHLLDRPRRDPLARIRLPPCPSLVSESGVLQHGRTAERPPIAPAAVVGLPIDRTVPPAGTPGGSQAAARAWKRFLAENLAKYPAGRNHPDDDVTSGLSPYLHFGHLSAHEVFAALAEAEDWTPGRLGERADGSSEGWWGMSPPAEAFLDELVTWRELGFTMTARRDDYDRFESLPDWAQQTLAEHARDPREYVYSLDEFERAQTHDRLWNAAQTQLVREGRLHNYLRMLWGKKILQWTATPRDAIEVMIELNNKYALDGRDPNSYSGIFWVLGRYDRPWGPKRPIFGTVRYMSSANTARKVRVKQYLRKYGQTQ